MDFLVTVSFISMEIYSHLEGLVHARFRGGQEDSRSQLQSYRHVHLKHTDLKRAEHRAPLRQYLRQAWDMVVQMESIHVKDPGLFNKTMHTKVLSTHLAHKASLNEHWCLAFLSP